MAEIELTPVDTTPPKPTTPQPPFSFPPPRELVRSLPPRDAPLQIYIQWWFVQALKGTRTWFRQLWLMLKKVPARQSRFTSTQIGFSWRRKPFLFIARIILPSLILVALSFLVMTPENLDSSDAVPERAVPSWPDPWPHDNRCPSWLLWSPTTSEHATAIAWAISQASGGREIRGFQTAELLHNYFKSQEHCVAAFSYEDIFFENRTLLLWWNRTTTPGMGTVLLGANEKHYRGDARTPLSLVLLQAEATVAGRKSGALGPNEHASIDVILRDIPKLPTTNNRFGQETLLNALGPFIVFVSLFSSLWFVLTNVQSERREGHREALRLLGLHDTVYWMHWLLSELLLMALAVIFVVVTGIVLETPFFSNNDVAVSGLVCFLFGANIIILGLCASTWGPLRAASLSVANWFNFACFVMGVPLMFFFTDNVIKVAPPEDGYRVYLVESGPVWWRMLQLSPAFLFARIYYDVLTLAASVVGPQGQTVSGVGYKWGDMSEDPLVLAGVGVGGEGAWQVVPSSGEEVLWMMLWAFLMFLATLYIDQVWPGIHGTPRSHFYFLDPSYWGMSSAGAAVDAEEESISGGGERRMSMSASMADLEKSRSYSQVLHQVLQDTDPDIANEVANATRIGPDATDYAIRMLRLSKTYRRSNRVVSTEDRRALDNLCLGMREGTVVALLGHNGAGKTTALSIMTGLTSATSGDVIVYGHSCVKHVEAVRRISGVCQQRDILFLELTGMDHMMLYSGLKNVSRLTAREESQNLLAAVHLTEQADRPVSQYSGGMKRRLCVALACVGAPKVLFLDEPTTSMDPLHRRQIWSLVQAMKPGRVILLTTHSMEEADVLADKVAVVALGRLRAVGTPLHLKSRWGAGYHISLIARRPEDVATLHEHVSDLLPMACLETDTGGSLTYSLPAATLTEFREFFAFVELQRMRKGDSKAMLEDGVSSLADDDGMVDDWAISHTTLEEVFIRLTHGDRGGRLSETGIVHGVDGSTETLQQLNVALEGQDDEETAAYVLVTPEDTLEDVRQLLSDGDGVEGIPLQYDFLMHGAPVPRTQEKHRRAVDRLPLITIRKDVEATKASPVPLIDSPPIHRSSSGHFANKDRKIALSDSGRRSSEDSQGRPSRKIRPHTPEEGEASPGSFSSPGKPRRGSLSSTARPGRPRRASSAISDGKLPGRGGRRTTRAGSISGSPAPGNSPIDPRRMAIAMNKLSNNELSLDEDAEYTSGGPLSTSSNSLLFRPDSPADFEAMRIYTEQLEKRLADALESRDAAMKLLQQQEQRRRIRPHSQSVGAEKVEEVAVVEQVTIEEESDGSEEEPKSPTLPPPVPPPHVESEPN